MLPYKCQNKIQVEELKRGWYRTVDKVLLPRQQHEGLLQGINSWATAHYWLDTMKNSLMITTDHRGMVEVLKAMDRVKWTTSMRKVQTIDDCQ